MRIVFRGTVQGVGFRPTVYRAAASLGLRGYVRNDGSSVTVVVDDGDAFLERFMEDLPPLAQVESVERFDEELDPSVSGFNIVPSSGGSRDGVSIPTDTAICDACVRDLREGRRKGYPFTTCTDCGPRFTLLRSLPYDRARTAMSDFPMCQRCESEYTDPLDRRFHHQTVCCPDCGPSYRLVGRDGTGIPGDPIAGFANILLDGGIGVAKSWGGMHICCTLPEIGHLREWYRRERKPFAVMARDMDAVRRYSEPTEAEERAMTSPHRPIVLVKKIPSEETEAASPGLDTVGMYLPYSGMHHLLFDALGDVDALVMTSANPPGEPMLLRDEEAFELGADAYLLHNQSIINRADDSVLRMRGDDAFFIRKSRGSIPSYYEVPFEGDAVGVGAQENLAGAVASGGRIYPTQHIGNGEGVGVPEYLEEAVRLQMGLLDSTPSIIAEDLHPAYRSRRLAHRLAEETGAQLIDVQHHWAHAASLMVDRNLDRITAIAIDGTGHGDDGAAWGGEVLSCDLEGYRRVAHLEYIPLIGGQKALYDIRRLRFAIDCMNDVEDDLFDDREAAVLRKLAPRSVKTSSMGRVLDALSFSLGACTRRTYDGEPAMSLEPLLSRGRLVDGLGTETVNGVVRTAHIFEDLDRIGNKADAAYTAVYRIMEQLVDAAADAAASDGEDFIGITGGVSYDVPIVDMAEELAKRRGMKLIVHGRVPNGDAGISTGQAAIALRRLRTESKVGLFVHPRIYLPTRGCSVQPVRRRSRREGIAMENTLFVLLDGLEDDPNPALDGKKPYEVARMPFMRRMAPHLNYTDGKGYTQLFLNEFWTGHPPQTPRGALEAQGLGMDMSPGRMAFRMSPAYVENGSVRWAYGVDEQADDLTQAVKDNLYLLEDHAPQIRFFVHGRAVITMYWDGEPPVTPSPPVDGPAARLEPSLQQFILQVAEEMDGLTLYPWACGRKAKVDPPFPQIGRMTAVSDSPTALGVAATLGHKTVLEDDLEKRFPIARRALRDGNVFLHMDEVDEYSHQKSWKKKVAVLERIDELMAEYFDDEPRTVIFADHGTSCVTGQHILTTVPFRTNVPIGDGKHFATAEVVPTVLETKR